MGRLRAAARIAVMVGALGSVVLMLYAGRRNPSGLLLVFFILWDLSPFVALAVANTMSTAWPPRFQRLLYGAMLAVALGSLAIYTDAVLVTHMPKVARVFLLVPLGSWILILPVAFLARRLSRR